MYIDSGLMLAITVMLFARVALGRPVPLAVFGAANAMWGLLLLGQLFATFVGMVMRVTELSPPTYYDAPVGVAGEFYSLVAMTLWTLFGFGVIGVIMLAAFLAPLKAEAAPEATSPAPAVPAPAAPAPAPAAPAPAAPAPAPVPA